MKAEIHLNLSPGEVPEGLPEEAKDFLKHLVLEVESTLNTLLNDTREQIEAIKKDLG